MSYDVQLFSTKLTKIKNQTSRKKDVRTTISEFFLKFNEEGKLCTKPTKNKILGLKCI